MPYVAVKINTGADGRLYDPGYRRRNGKPSADPAGHREGTSWPPSKPRITGPQMATVRPRSAPPALRQTGRKGEILRLSALLIYYRAGWKRVGFRSNTDKHGLAEAEIIVTVGAGHQKGEKYQAGSEIGANARGRPGGYQGRGGSRLVDLPAPDRPERENRQP